MRYLFFLIVLCIANLTAYSSGSALSKKEKIWLQCAVQHPFSSPEQKDLFSLSITGNSLLEGTAVFVITDFKGKETWVDTFPAASLLDMFPGTKSKQQEQHIRERVNGFFDTANFRSPAIGSEDAFLPEQSVGEAWEDIRSDPTAVGFFYLIDKANGRWIAWSKKLQKVVVYESCC